MAGLSPCFTAPRYTRSAQASVAENTASHTTITVQSRHAIELNAALKRAIQLKVENNAAATVGDEMLIEDIRELLHLSFEDELNVVVDQETSTAE